MENPNIIMDFEEIAKSYSEKGEKVILECSRDLEGDILNGRIILVKENLENILEGNTFEDFRNLIDDFKFVEYEEYEDHIYICMINPYSETGEEYVWRFYNIPLDIFKQLLEKYPKIEIR